MILGGLVDQVPDRHQPVRDRGAVPVGELLEDPRHLPEPGQVGLGLLGVLSVIIGQQDQLLDAAAEKLSTMVNSTSRD